MANVKQDAVLGVVFFAAIGLLLAATLLLTNFSFRERPRLEVRFASAGGLEKGDAVYVLGRRAGEVIDVAYRPENPTHRIVATLQLDEPLALRSDASIQIIDTNLLGGKRIEIEPGRSGAAAAADAALLGSVRKSAIDALGDELAGEDSLVGGLKNAVGKINTGQGTLAQLFNSPKLHDAVIAAVESATASLDAIRQGRSVVGRLVHDPDLGDDIAATLRNIRSVAQKADSGDGPLAMVLNDATVAGQVRGIVGDIAATTAEMREGKGVLGLVLRDPDARAKVQGILADVADLVAKTRSPDSGLAWALFHDTQMLADARGILTSMREFADRASNGNGLLARLVNDPDWGRRFGQILGQVQRAVEDAREAAPVGTFFQVLTGFF